ncbi:hypothetical protein EJ08DRAFT_392019 [Tothia fuscella]|uniref:MYND-type domain-containing protein n=1 Tax=Tothia fuscella TaxID=1048955 RepID=A0A9P4U1Y3_9PEZI|nr:hypothetical protein EJ08DRAFT_392019 [Tothia fuscella]
MKAEIDLAIPLKWCAKCKTDLYCSRECQTKDWKRHRKNCAANAAKAAVHQGEEKEEEVRRPEPASAYMHDYIESEEDDNEWEYREEDDWEDDDSENFSEDDDWEVDLSDSPFPEDLRRLPKKEVYWALLNAFGERAEIKFLMGGYLLTPKLDLPLFMESVESKVILPNWWNMSKRKECAKKLENMEYDVEMGNDYEDDYDDDNLTFLRPRKANEEQIRESMWGFYVPNDPIREDLSVRSTEDFYFRLVSSFNARLITMSKTVDL